METMQDYFLKERNKQLTYNMPFIRMFGVRLFTFFPNVALGFDVVAFDEWIAPEKNESTYQAIDRKFGKDAVELIRKLVG
jgi:hypothetical protein